MRTHELRVSFGAVFVQSPHGRFLIEMKEKEEEKRDHRELKARLLHRPIKMKGWRRRSFKKHAGLFRAGGGGRFFGPSPW